MLENRIIPVLGLICLLASFGCKYDRPVEMKVTYAVAVLMPTKSSMVTGIVQFVSVDDGIKVTATITGLSPGKHGFHIHEFGDMSSEDGSAAGGHFNPDGRNHGAPLSAEHHHIGDLGNITADKNGVAHLEFTTKEIDLNGPDNIIGRGVIVHEKEDDLKTQPSGAAGARVAQGSIGIAKGL